MRSSVAPITDLRSYLSVLRRNNQIFDVYAEVNPDLELAEIHRRVVAAQGPALLFHRVKGSKFPVVTNLFGTPERVSLAFANRPEDFVEELVGLATRHFPPSLGMLWEKRSQLAKVLRVGLKRKRYGPVLEQRMTVPNLESLPLIKSWPEDGGHFITLPLVYTEPPQGGPSNLGMYRMQRYDAQHCGLHWQIGKGGGYHYHQAEQQNQALPVNIFLGGPPALMLSAIAPLPENVPELLLASLLQGEKLQLCGHSDNHYPLIAQAEFALVGHAAPHVRRPEGPFGDHYGYYSLLHDFPVYRCDQIYHRKDAIYPATVVGKPRQEDFYLGDYLQNLLSPLFPVVMPGVKALWSYGETGFHSLSAAVVRERFYRECMHSAFRILGEGQLSLTKFLLVTDQPTDLRNFKKTLTTVLERFKPETDLFVFSNLSLDTLDYTGPELNKGSRGIMLGIGDKVRDLPEVFTGTLPSGASEAAAFCPGCLVLQARNGLSGEAVQKLTQHPDFAKWPLIIVVDSVKAASKSTENFLWTVFTRFEPAADIYAVASEVHRHHLCYRGPILIDARMKPSYPKEVLCDEQTAGLVSKRWHDYFPGGMAMGDSLAADVY